MLPRPHAGEQEEELLEQDQLYNNARPSHDRPSSRFARNRKKKSKQEMVDYTVLQEAESRSSIKASVVGRVVERSVPDPYTWAMAELARPQQQQPLGNPKAFSFPFQDFDSNSSKSLYRQYMESLGHKGDEEEDENDNMNAAAAKQTDCVTDAQIDSSSSRAVHGVGSLGRGSEEAAEIHKENLSRLAQLTPEQIQQEREQLMAQCDPDLLQYIKKLKQQKHKPDTSKCSENINLKKYTPEDSNKDNLKVQNNLGNQNLECERMQVDTEGEADQSSQNEGEGSMDCVNNTDQLNTSTVKSSTDSKISSDSKSVRGVRFQDDASKGVLDGGKSESKNASLVTESHEELSNDAMADNLMDTEEEDDPVPEDQLPIPPGEAKKWAHMDKVELDKLRWTTAMPAVAPLKHKDQGYVARFSFTGQLLPYDADVDYREGLHHHGQEPGRAGYSLDELFVLARSAVAQQRQLALTTLAAILNNLAQGHFHSCFQSPLLHMMLESGVVLLLRFSLDDGTPAVRVAGVAALAALMASEAIEGGLAAAHPWAGGCRPGVSSTLHAQEQVQQELSKEESELKDAELLQLDVIRALLRVDTLPRLRYMVEKLSPPPECVLHIISILVRMSSHSLTAAWKVASAPRLLACIVQRYLPHDTSKLITGENVDQMTSVEGVPLRHVLTLLKVLCCWGKHISQHILIQHDLLSRLLSYVSLDPTEVAMPLPEILRLCVDAYSVWDTLFGYGLQQPQESFLSFYPMLLRQLHFYKNKVSINEDTGSNQLNFDLGANLVHMLSRTISVAATKTLLDTQLRQSSGGLKVGLAEDGNPGDVLQSPIIGWENMIPVVEVVRVCCTKWCSQLQRGETTFSGLKLLGATFIFIENYFRKWKDQRNYSAVQFLTEIEVFYNDTLAPFLQCETFSKLLSQIKGHSALCSGLESSDCEDAKNLGSLNTVTLGGKVTPILLPSSPFPALLPLASLLYTLHQLHPSLAAAPSQSLLDHTQVVDYLHVLDNKPRQLSLRSQWFTRIEAAFLTNLILIAGVKTSKNPVLYHRVALLTLPSLQRGQEHLVKCLISDAICSDAGLKDLSELSTQVSTIGLNDYEPLKSPALFQPCLSPLQLTSKLLTDLSSVAGQLVTSLFETKLLKESVVSYKDIPFLISSMTIEQPECMSVLDDYWPLLPLKKIMLERIIKMTIANEKAKETSKKEPAASSEEKQYSDQSKPEEILEISRCLQMTYICLRYRNSTVMKSTNVTGWIRYISLAFLVANDLFLDHSVSSYLQGCLRELLLDGGHKKFNDKLQFAGLGNTFDWYKKLIEQFSAVSYGDYSFALMLLIPLQQKCPIAFRALLWGDLSDALPLVRLKTSDVETFMPVNAFLEPPEKDGEMLHKYKSAMVSGLISETRTPFLWSVALQHVQQEAASFAGQ